MITPINPTTDKKDRSRIMLTMETANPSAYPFAYVDNLWDVVREGTSLAQLTEAIGQFDQHTINEMFAALILSLLTPSTHRDFTDDFTDDFD